MKLKERNRIVVGLIVLIGAMMLVPSFSASIMQRNSMMMNEADLEEQLQNLYKDVEIFPDQ